MNLNYYTYLTTTQLFNKVINFCFLEGNKLQSAVLAVKGFNECHTAHNLQSELQSICKDWKIDKNKIVAVVSDHSPD